MSGRFQWPDWNNIKRLAAPCRSGLGFPTLQRFFGEPDRQAATTTKRCVIVPPVRHSMLLTGNVAPALGMKLERHDGSPRWPRQSPAPIFLKKTATPLFVQHSHVEHCRAKRQGVLRRGSAEKLADWIRDAKKYCQATVVLSALNFGQRFDRQVALLMISGECKHLSRARDSSRQF